MYTVGIASGLLKMTVFGPILTISPYFSCISWWIRCARLVVTQNTRWNSVMHAGKGPGMCLNRRHVLHSCKVASDTSTPAAIVNAWTLKLSPPKMPAEEAISVLRIPFPGVAYQIGPG